MTRLFGTDGVRGLANGLLTAELALDLSVSAAHVLAERGIFAGHRPFAVVGRDTRISGQFLESAVVAGLASAGVDVLLLGELPTPAVAHLTGSLGADLGVMLSASHNPMPDNGIKFLARGGVKLDDAIEDAIEQRLEEPWERPTGAGVGRVRHHESAVEDYTAHLVGTVRSLGPTRAAGEHAGPSAGGAGTSAGAADTSAGGADTSAGGADTSAGGADTSAAGRADTSAGGADTSDGRAQSRPRVVLDCAHGAASIAGPKALRDAGAEVIAICAEPDGLNINQGCGSTHLEVLRKAVLEHGADAGFALDGDADRCLAVDATGEVVDGDQILAILALALREQGRLHEDTVVVTVMSNLGLLQAMDAAGISVEQTAVGDRYVLEAMNASGYTLGGEQSGHVIMSEHATTGDGILTALQVLDRMAATGRSLAELASVVTRLPQVLVNVADVDRAGTGDAVLAAAVAEAEAELGSSGRILLRPSGTEPLVRVMVEAATAEHARAVAERLADVVRERLAL